MKSPVRRTLSIYGVSFNLCSYLRSTRCLAKYTLSIDLITPTLTLDTISR